MATWGPIQLRLKGSRQVEFDGEASPAPGGGAMPGAVLVKRHTISYADLLDTGSGYRFAPAQDLVADDWVLAIGMVCTVAFNDSNAGTLNLQVTDATNGVALSGTTCDGSLSPVNAVTGAPDPLSFAAAGFGTTTWGNVLDGLIELPTTAGVCDNGSMAGDGTAGELIVFVLYSPAP